MSNYESEQINIAGKNIQYVKTGSDGPSIVLLSGHRTPLSNWDRVIQSLVGQGVVLAYDRLDTGGSDKSSSPQSGDKILSTLDSLLEALELEPPFILVAHSLGGLYANLYARRNPEQVNAVILVEAGHPSEANEHQLSQKPRNGVAGKFLSLFTPDFRKDPNSEYNNVVTTVNEIEQAPEFPDIFVAVITGGIKMPFVPEAAFNSHLKWQEQLAELSSNSSQVIAEKSGHAPQISEPELIVNAIKKAIDSSK